MEIRVYEVTQRSTSRQRGGVEPSCRGGVTGPTLIPGRLGLRHWGKGKLRHCGRASLWSLRGLTPGGRALGVRPVLTLVRELPGGATNGDSSPARDGATLGGPRGRPGVGRMICPLPRAQPQGHLVPGGNANGGHSYRHGTGQGVDRATPLGSATGTLQPSTQGRQQGFKSLVLPLGRLGGRPVNGDPPARSHQGATGVRVPGPSRESRRCSVDHGRPKGLTQVGSTDTHAWGAGNGGHGAVGGSARVHILSVVPLGAAARTYS